MPYHRKRYQGFRHRNRFDRDDADSSQNSRNNYHIGKHVQGKARPFKEGVDNWFRISIPFVSNVDKSALCSKINDLSRRPVTLYNFFMDKKAEKVIFFVNSKSEANEIRAMSKCLVLGGRPVTIFANFVEEPTYIFEEDDIQIIKGVLAKRYDPQLKLLNLADLFNDEDLRNNGIILNLARTSCFVFLFDFIKDSYPECAVLDLSRNSLSALEAMKTINLPIERLNLSENRIHRLREMDCIKHLRLIELCIQDNPLCKQFKSEDALISAIREKCTRLMTLNGSELPPLIGFAVDEDIYRLPDSKPFFVPEELQVLLSQFVREYFTLFDAERRQPLIGAYAEKALLSVCASCYGRPFHFEKYIREGRNLLKVTEDVARFERMKRGRFDIISFFVKLPKTVHDIDSFKADVSCVKENFFAVNITGVYQEFSQDGKEKSFLRAFCRTFYCSVTPNGVAIVLEHMHVMDATLEQVRKYGNKALKAPTTEPTVKESDPSQNPKNEQLIKNLMDVTGMNRSYCVNCLSSNEWNYDQACSNFLDLKAKNMIPQEAFVP